MEEGEAGMEDGGKERELRAGESPQVWAWLLQKQEGSLEFSPPPTPGPMWPDVWWEPVRQS